MLRLISAASAWWRPLRAAAAGRVRRQDGSGAIAVLRARLARHGRGAWRHRRTAVGIAWSVCLIGWTGGVLLPDRAGPPVTPAGAAPAAVVGSASAGKHPAPAAVSARQLRDERAAVAGLQTDLDAALALRATHAGQLAGTPRLLAGRLNPIHQRRAIQLAQQDALIATLRLRLAARAAHAADLERHSAASAAAAGLRAAGGAAPVAAEPATAASAPVGSPRTGAARLAALGAVLLLAAAAGAACAVSRGGRDGIIDHPSQLRSRPALPVLCVIELPVPVAQAQRERASTRRAALAGLGLLGLFAVLVAAERCGVLAALRHGLAGDGAG